MKTFDMLVQDSALTYSHPVYGLWCSLSSLNMTAVLLILLVVSTSIILGTTGHETLDKDACLLQYCSICTEKNAKCNTPFLNESFFDSLNTNIKSLTLSFNPAGLHSEKVAPQMLSKFTKLEKLHLAGEISAIEFGALDSLTNLKHFRVAKTLMQSVPAVLFQYCKELETLEIQNVPLETLPFDALVTVEHGFELKITNDPPLPITLPCQNESLNAAQLPVRHDGLYANITSLFLVGLQVHVVNCTNLTLSADFFAPFKSLKNLDVSYSNFFINDSTLLSRLSVLQRLTANKIVPFTICPVTATNFFKSLPKTLTAATFTLWESVQPNNESCEFTKEALHPLSSLFHLKKLIFRFNNLGFGVNLDATIIPKIPRLTFLDLAYCGIGQINNLDKLSLPALEELILDGNFVGSRQKSNRVMNSTISKLYFSATGVWSTVMSDHNLAPLLQGFPGLNFLNLSNNYLKRPPIYHDNAIMKTRELTTLTLENNQILDTATLSNDNNSSMCKQFPNLTSISLARNFLWHLHGMCTQVKQLSLAGNSLTNSSSTINLIRKLAALEVLDLSRNRFRELSALLEPLTKLKELYVGENIIYKLPIDIFKNNLRLQKIYLESNYITVVQAMMFEHLTDLEILDLQSNDISIFPKDLLYNIDAAANIKHVYFNNNPIDCKCTQHYFQTWVKSTGKMQHRDQERLRCSTPSSQSGKHVLTYTDDVFECKFKQPLIISGSILAAAIVSMLIVVPCYKYFWFIKNIRIVSRAIVENLKSIKQEYACEYDAYVSYNREDEGDSFWVVQHLIPAVEGYHADSFSKHELKLYVEGRDAGCGTLVFTEKARVLEKCNKILIVVSNSYLRSAYCLGEADLTGREMHGTEFYQPNRVLVLVRDELTQEIIQPPMTALMEGKVIEVYHTSERQVQAMWKKVRRFLSKSKHLYLRSKSTTRSENVNISGSYQPLIHSTDVEGNDW